MGTAQQRRAKDEIDPKVIELTPAPAPISEEERRRRFEADRDDEFRRQQHADLMERQRIDSNRAHNRSWTKLVVSAIGALLLHPIAEKIAAYIPSPRPVIPHSQAAPATLESRRDANLSPVEEARLRQSTSSQSRESTSLLFDR